VHLGSGTIKEARLERLLGEVDPEGRMARLQVAIDDPLGEAQASLDERGVALLGSYVRVDVPLRPIAEAVEVPRTALREGDVVWIVDGDGRLEVREVEIGLRRDGSVVVTRGLSTGDRVITSAIAVPLPGMLVQPNADGGQPSVGLEGPGQ
jgi:multidrug efflux pump subunit AcrA (membrane-fusion protein)